MMCLWRAHRNFLTPRSLLPVHTYTTTCSADRGRADMTIDICGDVMRFFVNRLNLCNRAQFREFSRAAFSHDTLCLLRNLRLLDVAIRDADGKSNRV